MRILGLTVYVCALLLGGRVHAQAAPKYWVLEGGTNHALSPQGGALASRVVVSPALKIELDKLYVVVANVVVDTRRNPGLATCVRATPAFGTNGTPALVITVTCDHRRPDDYGITLAVRLKNAPSASPQGNGSTGADPAEAVQKIAPKLTGPKPELRAIAAQSVDRVVRWPLAQRTRHWQAS